MPDEITAMELALVTVIKALVGTDTKPMFGDVESYNGMLEGKSTPDIKAELERRGMHSAFVFNMHATLSKLARERVPGPGGTMVRAPRHKLMQFGVLVCAANLSGDASTRTGSPGSPGVYQLATAVSDAIDGIPLATGLPLPVLYTYEIIPVLSTPDFSIYLITLGPEPPKPYERP